MIRTLAIAAVLVASVAGVHAEDVAISDVDQCNETAMMLDGLLADTAVTGDDLATATDAVDSLKAACESGDLETANSAATTAQGILKTD